LCLRVAKFVILRKYLSVSGPAHPLVDEDGVGSNLVSYDDGLESVGLKEWIDVF